MTLPLDETAVTRSWWMPKESLLSLFDALHDAGYTIVGPTRVDEAIIYDELSSPDQLPQGWTDRQSAGHYRTVCSENDNYFEFNVGPQSWKQYLFPPRVTVQTATLGNDGDWAFESPPMDAPPMALLGVRACELAAIGVQDRVFRNGPYVDPDYHHRRENALIIAVNCTVANRNCFCDSTNTGPKCTSGFDLAFTEIEDGFVVEVASPKGKSIADQLPLRVAIEDQVRAATMFQQRAKDQLGKPLQTDQLPQVLRENLEHPHWDDVADRCLSCTNCTMVCPTCFCSSVSEVTDLVGNQVERQRQWDSCFNHSLSYTAGGTVRNDIRSRYRQWLTHKLSSWHEQFDVSGCVGCGRCVTWCPVGIDLREEVAALRHPTTTHRSVPMKGQAATACDLPKSAETGEHEALSDGADP